MKNGVFMRDELINEHLPLVRAIAKKVIHHSNLPPEDLIQEGTVGLMVAAEKFDHERGCKFATYAGWWIKQAMFKAISEQSHCMKIPVYVQETLSKYSKIKQEMEQRGESSTDVTKKIDECLKAYPKTISLNNDECNMAEIIADENADFIQVIELENLKTDIHSVVETLKERERNVIRMRFGLDECETQTLEQIGNLYGVTKECIRQTEMRALNKLRTSLAPYA
jgi:RNA polymerase primary sigma factor